MKDDSASYTDGNSTTGTANATENDTASHFDELRAVLAELQEIAAEVFPLFTDERTLFFPVREVSHHRSAAQKASVTPKPSRARCRSPPPVVNL